MFPTEPASTLTAAMLALAAFTEPAPRLTAGSALALLVLGAACTAGGFAAFSRSSTPLARREPL
ncbi:hypothetical protein [Streptomyces sp. NPDC056883]|uniref:hypothetical protein n=1 Tax=Streptomyces sp. NPDC056883 TaxID=3345959 RepID=UPI0036B741A1